MDKEEKKDTSVPAGSNPPPPEPEIVPGMKDDIANILKEVKLPVRNEFKGGGDKAPTVPVVETPPPETPPTPTPTPEKKTVVPLHTLKDDLQTVVKDQKMSVIRATALEEDKKTAREEEIRTTAVEKSHRGRMLGMIIFAVVLLVIGGISLSIVFMIMQERSGSSGEEVLSPSLIFSEQKIPFAIGNQSPDELKRSLLNARETTALTLGAITHLDPIIQVTDPETQQAGEREATLHEFLKALGSHAPDELLRALDTRFYFGMHTVDEQAPLFVIQVKSYERAFAGMLAWEKEMNADLTPFFTGVPKLVNGEIITERKFTDEIMRNFDVRVLKDDTGAIQLYYSFPTRDILIIAESPYSFAEILSRLRAERRL